MRTRIVVAALLLHGDAFAALGDNDVGMNVHNAPPSYVAASADLGVTWIRMDANWFQLEPVDDDYRWAQLDTAIVAANAAGLKVYLTLGYTPSWVPRHGDTDGRSDNDVPNTSNEWTDFVRAAVTHFRTLGVRHFGLWNEANLQGFWEGTLTEYAAIVVNPGAAAVRAVCNDCVVLGPDLANVGAADDALEEVLMRTPGAWDIITHHIYNDFEETGWRVWDGDSYINVLDDQRFSFTRRSLRQILDGAGWMGEVWITETGYRATVGDVNDEQLQAVYVRRALEEQLQRAWITNTFFYEIHDCGPDQPTCTIDGFGLMRATSGTPGTRAFPNDFRLKPAFGELRQFITNNPAVVSGTPTPQCGDGQDNDGDGRVDLEDRGCSGAADDDESDDPPRQRIDAASMTVVLDGDLVEFGSPGWLTLDETSWRGTEPLGMGDLWVGVAARYDADHLYLGVEVVDDVHVNDRTTALWQSDSVQIAIDVGQTGGTGYDADDHEFTVAASTDLSTANAVREVGTVTGVDEIRVGAARVGDRTRYEVAIARTALPGAVFAQGSVIGFSFLVNDDDGQGRVGWIEWTSGIGLEKVPESFGEIAFVAGGPTIDGGVSRDGSAPDGEPRVDAGSNVDASLPPSDAGPGRDAGQAGPDAGVSVVESPTADESCSCSTTRRGDAAWWVFSALPFIRRRRASRSGPDTSGSS